MCTLSITSALAQVFLFFLFFTLSDARVQLAKRPNFILIIADDMAWDDWGAYGHKMIRTPNIDQLARQDMRFDRAFLTASSDVVFQVIHRYRLSADTGG